MARISPIPQPASEAGASAAVRLEAAGRATWDFESLSWLVPRVPLRQVICILGTGQDPMKEQFRLLRTRLEDLRQTRPLKTILVTSSLPEEGKTFVALNLAATVSQRGRNKVLLLEADLRRPSCCSALGLGPLPGLAGVLRETWSFGRLRLPGQRAGSVPVAGGRALCAGQRVPAFPAHDASHSRDRQGL